MTSYLLLKKMFTVQVQIDKVALDNIKSEKQKMSATKRKYVQILKRISNERTKIKTCRLCLKFGTKAIFENEGDLGLAADIEFTLGIKISKDDAGPHFLCSSCESTVEAATQLKRLAQLSQWTLQKETEILAEEESTTPEPFHDQFHEPFEMEPTDRSCSTETTKGARVRGVRDRRWRCKKCREKFDTEEKFEGHKQQKCRKPPPRRPRGAETYVCDICGMKFSFAHKLKTHFKEYHSDQWYECGSCPYRSRKKAALVHHLRVHSGEKPLKCPHCPATFATASNLASHRYRHFPPRHRCDQCQRMFKFKQSLENHLKTQHSTIKANPCSVCDKSYATRKLLRRHEIRIHNCPKKKGGSMPTYVRLQMEAEQST